MKNKEAKISANSGRLSIDPALDKLSSVILFPAKLKFANSQLKKTGFPSPLTIDVKKAR